MLILVMGSINILPRLEEFENIEDWTQLSGFKSSWVNEEIGREILQLPDVVAVQIREIPTLLLGISFSKGIFLHSESFTEGRGLFPTICINYGVIGHQKL